MTCLQSVEKNAESLRSTPKNGAGEGRFDASHKRHPVTETSYINSLANRPYRSTVKTLPATLPEPWTTVRGPSSKQIGPWFTDREPRSGDRVPRFKLRGSRLVDAGSGLLGAFAESERNWFEGVGLGLVGARASDLVRVMYLWKESDPKSLRSKFS